MPELRLPRRRYGPLAVVEAGQGEVVLLLHGIGSSADGFRAQLEALAPRRRAIAWDAPGYGASEDPDSAPGMDGYADAAAGLLQELQRMPAHVVGSSWGGVVATRLALRHPTLVRSLVLADSTRGSGVAPSRASAMRRRAGELAHTGRSAFAAARAPRLLSPGAPPALVDDVAEAMAAAVRMPGYGWVAAAMAETDHSAELRRIDVPTLVVVGEHDAVTPPSESRAIAGGIPGARLELVAGAGHLSHQERPTRFNQLLLAFLDEVEATSRARSATPSGGATTP